MRRAGLVSITPMVAQPTTTRTHKGTSPNKPEGKISNLDIVYSGSYLQRTTDTEQDYTDYSYFYDTLYGYSMPGAPMELINLRVSARGVTDKPQFAGLSGADLVAKANTTYQAALALPVDQKRAELLRASQMLDEALALTPQDASARQVNTAIKTRRIISCPPCSTSSAWRFLLRQGSDRSSRWRPLLIRRHGCSPSS